jgi:hypothetical protein
MAFEVPSDPPSEGGETRRNADFYKVPLRTYLWLVVPAAVGAALGLALAHREAGPPLTRAAAPSSVVRCCSVVSSPERVYRPAHARVGLTPLRQALASASSGVAAGSTSIHIPQKNRDTVIPFSTEPRTFEENSQPSGEPAPTIAPDPATVPAPPIQITDVHTMALSPFSATIAWHTSEAVSSQVAYGLDSRTLWSAADPPALDHTAVVNGLAFDTTYRLWVDAHAADGRTASSPFLLTTPALPSHVTGGTGASAFLVDGQLYFPFMVWAACPDAYASRLSAGIDLFMGKDCGSPAKQLSALSGRGLLVSDAKDPAADGAVGTFLPDEWDTYLPGNLTAAAAQHLLPDNGGGPRFLTLTNHFYSRAAPLPQGRGMYPALIQNADVVGFDLYPLQNWCRFDDFGHVFDSQRELVQLAVGKPTFQWIEARRMDCHDPTLNPTSATVHAETWLAVAGGAHAMAYFPYDFSADIGAQIASDKRAIQALVPALLEPAIQADAGNGQIRVGAREHNGAIYVIAVNASRVTATSTISVPALGDRPLVSLDGSRSVTAASGTFTDTFAPLEVHVYIAAPPTS